MRSGRRNSPAPWQDVWVGGNAQGVVFEVMRNGIPVRVLRKYEQLGIKDWRTLVCDHDTWPDLPDLRARMEAAAEAVAAQNPRVIPESAAAHRVSLVVFADSDTAYYAYNGHGAIVFRVDFKPVTTATRWCTSCRMVCSSSTASERLRGARTPLLTRCCSP